MAIRLAALRAMAGSAEGDTPQQRDIAQGDTPRLSTPKKSCPLRQGDTPQRQGRRAPLQRATPTKVSPLQQARGEFNKTHRRLAIAMLIDTQAQDIAVKKSIAAKGDGIAATAASRDGDDTAAQSVVTAATDEGIATSTPHVSKVNSKLATLWAQSDVRANYMAALPEQTIKRRKLHKTSERHA